ncbi:hypothetical protein ACFV1L_13105 [Kitasatospora sp. NPDC059646]|uniref:hypothetical protein n=1 Tax=Kitasatospora sp. NPDC059646 TaxID=3346893 RepID=UPI003691FB04
MGEVVTGLAGRVELLQQGGQLVAEGVLDRVGVANKVAPENLAQPFGHAGGRRA